MGFLRAALAFAGLVASAGIAVGQSQTGWQPTEPVEFVVPHTVGGGADVIARIMAQVMVEKKLVPVPVQVVNRGGGGTAVGLSYVLANRAGNPNTLILTTSPTQINPIVVAGAPGINDLLPIYNFMVDDFVLVVRSDSKWKSAAELVAAAKQMPAKSVAAGSSGPKSGSDSMAIASFANASGIDLNVVSFNGGGEVVPALLGGHVDMTASNPSEYVAHMKAGDVRFLGVFRDERFADLPDVATMKEQGIDAKPPQVWRGIALPKGVPPEAVAYWEGVMDVVATSQPVQDYLRENLATSRNLKGQKLQDYLSAQEQLVRKFLAQ